VTAAAAILHQRSRGEIVLRFETAGLARLREEGAAKVRFPHGGHQAILINTGGGLAGGDRFSVTIAAGPSASLTVTTQAAERVYRTLGPAASVDVSLTAEAGATLFWLPQETMLFEGASLARTIAADIAPGATFLAVESIVFGRAAMGEVVTSLFLRDRWRVKRGGKTTFADDIAIAGPPPMSAATLAKNRAMATVLLISADAGTKIEAVRGALGEASGASAWNGKLVARFLARDGFELRKTLIPVLRVLSDGIDLPKAWSQ
jgi:urease accessory protein